MAITAGDIRNGKTLEIEGVFSRLLNSSMLSPAKAQHSFVLS